MELPSWKRFALKIFHLSFVVMVILVYLWEFKEEREKILKISVGGKEGKKKFDAFICGMKIISIWAIFFLFLFSIWQIGTESGKILKNLKFYFCLCSLLMFSIKSSSWLVDELLLGSLYKWSCMNNLFEVKFKTYSKGYAVIIFIPL